MEIETDCKALKDVLSNDNILAAHGRWRDGILAHNIVAIRHVPGCLNGIADGLSRQWDNTSRTDCSEPDGSEWSVNPELETLSGLVNNMFTIDKLSPDNQDLRNCFQHEPLFLEVIDAISV